jgi:hypothetical protein
MGPRESLARIAGIGHVHPHQLRHTLATQSINNGMRLEAISQMLGHRSMRMTLVYARIADRTVADEYFAAANKVDQLYQTHLTTSPASGPSKSHAPRWVLVGIMRGTIEWSPRARVPSSGFRPSSNLCGSCVERTCRAICAAGWGRRSCERRCSTWALPSLCTLPSVKSARPIGWGSRSNGTGGLNSGCGNQWACNHRSDGCDSERGRWSGYRRQATVHRRCSSTVRRTPARAGCR